jgi:(+)-trans-carveol dehydrogenase
VIAVDLFAEIETPQGAPGPADLEKTARLVEAQGRRIVCGEADVRKYEELEAVLDRGIAELGRLDIVCANAGIGRDGVSRELSEDAWRNMIDINLTGVWHTTKATSRGCWIENEGGSIRVNRSTPPRSTRR